MVILTLNEEINVADCIRSLAGCDDVHVLDSGSTDRTREIAAGLGAGVHVNRFESFGKQRNWAIDHIPLRHDWVLHLDADERLTPEGLAELRQVVASAPPHAGWYLPSKLVFMGRWLKRAGGYPTYQMRFFHKGRMRFMDYGHGQRELTQGRSAPCANRTCTWPSARAWTTGWPSTTATARRRLRRRSRSAGSRSPGEISPPATACGAAGP